MLHMCSLLQILTYFNKFVHKVWQSFFFFCKSPKTLNSTSEKWESYTFIVPRSKNRHIFEMHLSWKRLGLIYLPVSMCLMWVDRWLIFGSETTHNNQNGSMKLEYEEKYALFILGWSVALNSKGKHIWVVLNLDIQHMSPCCQRI